MNFLYPIGLLGLIGVPILIIIYILKSKYTEQTVSSTYLWTLSEKFLKRKNPISKLTGIISLILQILAVVAISFAIAHPVFILEGLANEYCFVLDGSGSMNIVQNGETRFETAKNKIAETIETSAGGSTYSLIYVGSTTRTVYERITDKEDALSMLMETQVSDVEIDTSDAIGIAQGYFNANPSILTYLATDVNYAPHLCVNVKLLKVGSPVDNCGLQNVTYDFSGGELTVSGVIKSYYTSKVINLELYVDDFDVPVKTAGWMANAGDAAGTPFMITCAAETFSKMKVAIVEEDALLHDNEIVLFNVKSEITYKTLIVSEKPFFFESAIKAVSGAAVDTVTPTEYEKNASYASGYGLYIFETFAPKEMPKDGTVWFINPQSQIKDAGFTVQDPEVILDGGQVLQRSTSSSSTVQKLTQNTFGQDIYVAKYVKCGLYKAFTTLYSYRGNPIVFAGSNSHGNREVVFAFDLRDSNAAVLPDFVTLTRNLLEYSFPEFLEKVSYFAGEELEVNVTSNCDSIKLESPSGEVAYLNTDNTVARYALEEVGAYKLTLTVAGTPREFSVYASMPEAERNVYPLDGTQKGFALQGIAGNEGYDGIYDDLLILFIFLAVVFAADWAVYCYEKYQLR